MARCRPAYSGSATFEDKCMPPPIHDIDTELDLARTEGPVRTIVIPPCPALLVRLQDVMKRADPDWAKVREIAAADVAMAASLVRAANSPLYARSSTVQGVDQAMALLGLRQTAALLTQFLTARALPIKHPALENFWETSAQRAHAISYIARQLYNLPVDLAHAFGLFCDVGVPILLKSLPGYGGTLAEARARRDRAMTVTEQAAHRTDHAIVGALVARTWRLPAELKQAIRLHHDVDVLADRQVDETIRTLIAAGLAAEHVVAQWAGLPTSVEWSQRGAGCLQHLQVDAAELLHWQDELACLSADSSG
jgi:HD-like signal output (HDOD) protein